MNHDRLCGWSNRPGEWEALAASVPDPPTECSTCVDITRARDDERARIRQALVEIFEPYRIDYGTRTVDMIRVWAIFDGEESVRPT